MKVIDGGFGNDKEDSTPKDVAEDVLNNALGECDGFDGCAVIMVGPEGHLNISSNMSMAYFNFIIDIAKMTILEGDVE